MARDSGSSELGDAVAKPRDDRQKDLLRPALQDIIDLAHPPVRLAREIDWQFLDARFSSVCAAGRRPAAVGNAAVHSQAHAQPVGRGFVRALAGEPVLPILLPRVELLPPATVDRSSLTPAVPVEEFASAEQESYLPAIDRCP